MPISPSLVLARVATQVPLKRANDWLADNNRFLSVEVERRTREVQKVQEVTIMAMASLAETRDYEIGMHIRRTQNYVLALAEDLQWNSTYGAFLDAVSIDILYKSAPCMTLARWVSPMAFSSSPAS
jgi:putative two-component system response regulator